MNAATIDRTKSIDQHQNPEQDNTDLWTYNHRGNFSFFFFLKKCIHLLLTSLKKAKKTYRSKSKTPTLHKPQENERLPKQKRNDSIKRKKCTGKRERAKQGYD